MVRGMAEMEFVYDKEAIEFCQKLGFRPTEIASRSEHGISAYTRQSPEQP